MRWFRKLVGFLPWRLVPRHTAPTAPVLRSTAPAPMWTADCAIQWKNFISSPTGQIFMARFYAMQAATAVAAVRAQSVGETHNPTFEDAVNWVESLSRMTGDQVITDEQPTDGESADFETPVAL